VGGGYCGGDGVNKYGSLVKLNSFYSEDYQQQLLQICPIVQ
jgi:hypothetical protein